MQFNGTKDYISTDDLTVAVNASIALEKPLLVKGEPGTGKTELARQISESLGLEIIEWNIKSTTKAQQGLYEYDAVSRLRDSQLGDKKIENVSHYIKKGKIWNIPQNLYSPINQDVIMLLSGKKKSGAFKFLEFLISDNIKKKIRDFGYIVK